MIALAVFLAVAICGSSAAQQPVVVELAAEGNKEIASQYVLGVVGTKVGDRLSREQIDRDIEAIYNSGFFFIRRCQVGDQARRREGRLCGAGKSSGEGDQV